MAYKIITAQEAASHIKHKMLIGVSGFTYAGSPKATLQAIAQQAKELHSIGKSYKIKLLSGASIGAKEGDMLAEAEALSWRAPYQSSTGERNGINSGKIRYVDMHLSGVGHLLESNFLDEDLEVAIVEATKITEYGKVYLTSGIGNSPVFLRRAKKVIIELNHYHNERVSDLADITYSGSMPPYPEIPVESVLDRVGTQFVKIDPKKVIGIVETNQSESDSGFDKANPLSEKIANNVAKFLLNEMAVGRIPRNFLPLQSGVGNINNAVLETLGKNDDIPNFQMYSEVLQESVIDLMERGNCTAVSASSLTVSAPTLEHIYENMDYFGKKIVLRPAEISNNPAIIHRLGVIALNVAIEADLYGHVNSSHIAGTKIMNGVGGSADFTRSAYLSIFMCPSFAKGGAISSIVPFCSHIDHSEHSAQIIITDQGIADLRGLSPISRSKVIITNCAHPAYRDYLHDYLRKSKNSHIRHNLKHVFDLHNNLLDYGKMLPDLNYDFSK